MSTEEVMPIDDKISLFKVISGGQTGADRAGLEAARYHGIETGGWAPRGFKTTKGADLSLQTFGLQEHKSCGYVVRSKANVDSSDATLIFKIRSSLGTEKTIGYCSRGVWSNIVCFPSVHKPYIVLSDCVQIDTSPSLWERDADKLRKFLRVYGVKTLNVAGHRQDDSDPTWQKRVFLFLVYALWPTPDTARTAWLHSCF